MKLSVECEFFCWLGNFGLVVIFFVECEIYCWLGNFGLVLNFFVE